MKNEVKQKMCMNCQHYDVMNPYCHNQLSDFYHDLTDLAFTCDRWERQKGSDSQDDNA